jgi:soluble lytic murein transglycosylase-like protein
LLTKRTYSALVLVLLVAFPAVALAAAGDDLRATKQLSGPRIGLADAKPVFHGQLIISAANFDHQIRAGARRIRAARRARLQKERREAFATLPAGVSMATLEAIASCESGGNPTAISSDGSYRGKYQFSFETWASVGGSGDPAAASEPEQDYRAALLYAASGPSPWPVCGQ